MNADTKYIAHTREIDEKTQPLIEHLQGSAELARNFAAPWGGAFAELCALAHDAGKYSDAFQARIRGAKKKVDHATAGGQLLHEKMNKSIIATLAAYCITGHHGGLLNGGTTGQAENEDRTLYQHLAKKVEDYSAYKKELSFPELTSLDLKFLDGFEVSFFVRMIFSALVDADWLDTEKFCNAGNAPRGGFASISELYECLSVLTKKFLNPEKELSELYQKRNELLRDCLAAADLPGGIFTLTAPTGSGKTIASLAFALKHALKHGKSRVIYIVPFNTIIEQNAAVFEDVLGAENVLRHNSDVSYDDEDGVSINKRHSVENWDYPLIVTSSVQFFESLFANKPSKCRKLHNIADSVLIFDEAQMIPVPFLLPCIRAIKTLSEHYGCSAVLATATQSSLDGFFIEKPRELSLTEITKAPAELYLALRRCTIRRVETLLSNESLIERLLNEKSVLCIVNTRRHAQELFTLLNKSEAEGTFHLSTTMIPAHRKKVLKTIRERLKNGLPCRVISTSLVEAGVDLDFETVYREQAGLDSIVQAAGRCNREGKRGAEDSNVFVFSFEEEKIPGSIRSNIDAYKQTARRFDDLGDPQAIRAYFEQLFYNLGRERLDDKNILPLFNDGARAVSFRFEDAAKTFKLIDDSAQQTVYVLQNAPELENRLFAGERGREIFRELSPYAVSLYENDIRALRDIRAITQPDKYDPNVLLLYELYYDKQMGVKLSPEGGQGDFV